MTHLFGKRILKNRYTTNQRKSNTIKPVLESVTVWLPVQTINLLREVGQKDSLNLPITAALILHKILNTGVTTIKYKLPEADVSMTHEDKISKLIYATMRDGIHVQDLTMILVDQGLSLDEISAGINGLVDQGMVDYYKDFLKYKYFGNSRKVMRKHKSKTVTNTSDEPVTVLVNKKER